MSETIYLKAEIEDNTIIDFRTENPEDMVALTKIVMDMVELGISAQVLDPENQILRIAAKPRNL